MLPDFSSHFNIRHPRPGTQPSSATLSPGKLKAFLRFPRGKHLTTRSPTPWRDSSFWGYRLPPTEPEDTPPLPKDKAPSCSTRTRWRVSKSDQLSSCRSRSRSMVQRPSYATPAPRRSKAETGPFTPPSQDSIRIPPIGLFGDRATGYSTIVHALTHWEARYRHGQRQKVGGIPQKCKKFSRMYSQKRKKAYERW